MADTRYILGIDQGTTSTRAVLFDDGVFSWRGVLDGLGVFLRIAV